MALLLWEIPNLYRENNPESQAVFVDHNVYCFWKIIDSLGILEVFNNEDTLPSHIYIQDIHQ